MWQPYVDRFMIPFSIDACHHHLTVIVSGCGHSELKTFNNILISRPIAYFRNVLAIQITGTPLF